MRQLTKDQARRYTLAAQGFNEDRAEGRVDVRHFRKVMSQIGLVQLDSVNVFSRTHYLPFFSRIGPYARESLDDWIWGSGELFEYWGHEASIIPVEDHRLLRWRMNRPMKWKRLDALQESHPGYIEEVYTQVVERGPLQTRDLDRPGRRDNDAMWGWNDGKVALEVLFLQGRVTTSHRQNFVRMYDLTGRVIDAEHLDSSDPTQDEAITELLSKAAGYMGVGTAEDIADYYRIRLPAARPLIRRLVEDDVLEEVEVEGWGKPGYLHPEAMLPRRARGTALLSPFDNLIWYRPRVKRLWDFDYRIEIYVPEPDRQYGYYVLPFLLDGMLVARVDLKTDRRDEVLKVQGAFAEPDVDEKAVGRALRRELDLIADWLDLDDVVIARNGDLYPYL